ncbi:hypothetical protein A4G18_09220 [Pasteurellaceae bacterium Pebbles2]|nr:hypothetical protein [Pasteurellaceae bacterium Pebbles2]
MTLNDKLYFIDKLRDKILSLDLADRNEVDKKIMYAALDVVSDTDSGINAYLNLENTEERGMNYIYIYGLINILQSQVSAIQTIYKFFLNENLDISKNDILNGLRVLRNKIFAHSVEIIDEKKNKGRVENKNIKEESGFGIVSDTMKTFYFDFYKVGIEEIDDFKVYKEICPIASNKFENYSMGININYLIRLYSKEVIKILENIAEHLESKS